MLGHGFEGIRRLECVSGWRDMFDAGQVGGIRSMQIRLGGARPTRVRLEGQGRSIQVRMEGYVRCRSGWRDKVNADQVGRDKADAGHKLEGQG